MLDVIFITPNIDGNVRDEPFGTLILSTILKNAHISVEIIPFHSIGDINNFDNFLSSAETLLKKKCPRILSFYTRVDTYHISIVLAKHFKHLFPDNYVVFGGPQSDLCAVESLRCLPFLDFVCCGEGETTILPFFSSLLHSSPDYSTPGLVFRQNSEIVQNKRPALISDLDTVPFIDYSLLHYDNSSSNTSKTLFPIDVGRGCPFGCSYCSTKSFWGQKYRLKSEERIIREIINAHDTFGVTDFNFEHDMFTLNRDKIISICTYIKQLDFKINWRCSARLDCLDNEMIDIMYSAGLRIIFVGIESGSPQIQRSIHKNLKLDKAVELVKYISGKGITVTASFMFGFPQETPVNLNQTISLYLNLSRIKNVVVQLHLLAFLPATELYEEYKSSLIPSDSVSNITGCIALDECKSILDAYPTLFSQYMEYPTELRKEMKYLRAFLFSYRNFFPVYEYIVRNYFGNSYYDACIAWTKMNSSVLNTFSSMTDAENFWKLPDINDKFLQIIDEPAVRTKAQAIENYFQIIKQKKECDCVILPFCVDDLSDNKRLEDFSSGFSLISASDKNGYTVAYKIVRDIHK